MDLWEEGGANTENYSEVAQSLARVTSSLSCMNSTALVSALEHSASMMHALAQTLQQKTLQNSGATEEDTSFMGAVGSSFDDPLFPLDTYDSMFDVEPMKLEPPPASPISKTMRKRISARERDTHAAPIKRHSRRERHGRRRLIETMTHVHTPRPKTCTFGITPNITTKKKKKAAALPHPHMKSHAIIGPTGRLMTVDYFSTVLSMPYVRGVSHKE